MVVQVEPAELSTTSRRAALRWLLVRQALAETATRFGALLRSIANPTAPAIGDWTVGEAAAHVRVVALLDTLLATGEPPSSDLADLVHTAAHATISTVGPEINRRSLEWEARRDPTALAGAIEAQVDHLLQVTSGVPGDVAVTWLGGLRLARVSVLTHLLSELLVHGFDIAHAAGRPFLVPPAHARLYFETFLPDVVRNADSVGFFDAPIAPGVGDVSWELRIRGGTPVRFAFSHGRVRVMDHDGAVDVRISANAAAMLLVMYDRISPGRPMLLGQVVVWGRRPWRIRRMMQVLQLP